MICISIFPSKIYICITTKKQLTLEQTNKQNSTMFNIRAHTHTHTKKEKKKSGMSKWQLFLLTPAITRDILDTPILKYFTKSENYATQTNFWGLMSEYDSE